MVLHHPYIPNDPCQSMPGGIKTKHDEVLKVNTLFRFIKGVKLYNKLSHRSMKIRLTRYLFTIIYLYIHILIYIYRNRSPQRNDEYLPSSPMVYRLSWTASSVSFRCPWSPTPKPVTSHGQPLEAAACRAWRAPRGRIRDLTCTMSRAISPGVHGSFGIMKDHHLGTFW
jgi:hypothetical protein